MMSPGDISRLLEDIATAMDETHITDLLVGSLAALATLPPLEAERVCARIQDVIAEHRAWSGDQND